MTSPCCDKLKIVRSWSHIHNLQLHGNALLWLHMFHVSPCTGYVDMLLVERKIWTLNKTTPAT